MLNSLFFAVEVYTNYDEEEDSQKKGLLFILLFISIGFLLLPLFMNFRALLKSERDWTQNPLHGDRYRAYLNVFGRPLFFLSLVSGSSFAAVQLVNSNLFGWRMFSVKFFNFIQHNNQQFE